MALRNLHRRAYAGVTLLAAAVAPMACADATAGRTPRPPSAAAMNLLLEMERGLPGFQWSNGAPTDRSVNALYVDWAKVFVPV